MGLFDFLKGNEKKKEQTNKKRDSTNTNPAAS